jgi:hypothetical protein
MNVKVMLKFRFPLRRMVHMFDAPPPGEHPVTKSPNWRDGDGNKSCDSPKAS